MDELKIKELLNLQRSLTSEEQVILEDWYNRFPQYDEITFGSSFEKEKIKAEIKAAVYEGINEPMPARRKNVVTFRFVRGVAAAVVLLGLCLAAWMYWGSDIRLQGHGPELAYTEVTAPLGKENLLVTLPDSSKVWLLAGTTLKFPQRFEKAKREVELINGMAFFTVIHNEDAPFSVTTSGKVRTTVLGTSFNISAYKTSDQVAVSVVTGRVKVSAPRGSLGTITPDQQIVYSKASGESKQQHVDAQQLVDWVKGNIMLNDADFNEVAQIIEAVYQVKMSYDKKALSGLRFNFRFSKKSPLREPLDILKDLSNTDYRIQNDTVILSKTN